VNDAMTIVRGDELPVWFGPLGTTLIPPFADLVVGYSDGQLSELVEHCVRRFHRETDPALTAMERLRAMGAIRG
jgi:hypothetical protein